MAQLDWAGTPLGPVDGWPQSLRAAVRIVLSSRYPMLLLWGESYSQLYNDAYSALIGDKHPAALGDDVRVTLAEGWDVLAPLIEEAMATGVASWVPALQLLLERAGYREEAYFSVSHAPARDDEGRTVGVLTVCSEVTQQVVGERRLRLLRDLSVLGDGRTVDVDATGARLIDVIDGHPLDVPFAAIYLRDGAVLRRVACTGGDQARRALPDAVELTDPGPPAYAWGLADAAEGRGDPGDRRRRPAAAARRPVERPGPHRAGAAAAVRRRGPAARRPARRGQPQPRARRGVPLVPPAARPADLRGAAQRPGVRGGAAPGRGDGGTGPGQDRLLRQRQPRVPYPVDPHPRPADRRPHRRHRAVGGGAAGAGGDRLA